MIIKNLTKIALAGITLAAITNCGGGGSGSISTGGKYYSHEEVAEIFVERVYSDVGEDLVLLKANTLRYGYIVARNYTYGTIDGYFIDEYNVGEDLRDYLSDYDHKNEYNLTSLGNNTYQDQNGILYSRVQGTNFNVQEIQAAKMYVNIRRSANDLQDKLSVPSALAFSLAKFGASMQGDKISEMSEDEIVGAGKTLFSHVDPVKFIAAFSRDDKNALRSMYSKVARDYSTSPEQIAFAVSEYVGTLKADGYLK